MRFAIQRNDFAEIFFLVFMKFVNQFLIHNRSFKIFTEYCLRNEIAKTFYLFAEMSFYLMLNKNTLVVLVPSVRAVCYADLLFHAMSVYTSVRV